MNYAQRRLYVEGYFEKRDFHEANTRLRLRNGGTGIHLVRSITPKVTCI